MATERHRVLSANFIEAVERADAARTECMRSFLFFWWSPRGEFTQAGVAGEPKALVSTSQANWQTPPGNVIR